MQLHEYLLNIEYKKGKIHLDVDRLSKYSVKEEVYSLPEKKSVYSLPEKKSVYSLPEKNTVSENKPFEKPNNIR